MANVSGLASWFGGPHDSTDSGHTASGQTTATPGIAIYDRSTIGHWFRVTAPNGRVAILQQTDLGPAPWTGKKIDITYSALSALGYAESNFPTGQGIFSAVDLGPNKPSGAVGAVGSTSPASQSAIAAGLTPAQAQAAGCGPVLLAVLPVLLATTWCAARVIS